MKHIVHRVDGHFFFIEPFVQTERHFRCCIFPCFVTYGLGSTPLWTCARTFSATL